MRGMKRHEDFSLGTSIGSAVGRPHFLFVESGITTVGIGQTPVGGGPNFGTAFQVNNQAAFHSMRTDDSADFYFGRGDFTIECWIQFSSVPDNFTRLFLLRGFDDDFPGQTTPGLGLYMLSYNTPTSNYGDDRFVFSKDFGGTASPVTVTRQNWNHLAVTRTGGYEYFFVNGTQCDFDIGNENYTGTSIEIAGEYGAGQDPGFPVDDYDATYWLDDIRITRQALYTANFTPTPRQTIYNTANTMAFFSSGTITDGLAFDDITTDSQTVIIESGYAPAGYVTIT